MKKREFIKNLGLMGISPLIPRETSLNNSSNEIILFSKTDSDDDFWNKSIMNFINGLILKNLMILRQ